MSTIPAVAARTSACLTGLLLLAAGVSAQEADLEEQIQELKRGQQEIRRELAEIKRLLQQAPRAAQAARSAVEGKLFDLGDNPVIGEATAKLTLVEFTDYQ